ncbi:peptidoglycan hydrolase CwlO-like protein [Cytobacillus eiseniae]|uniref:Peptidoglycan hydrolase CwlO-like protein n=1 Tax=Cytobacillus eiseniae TaxID=762947 RepID=A0ABS4RHR5_9BACI|nr:peptidoglycan DD-metalloendopeptidase family protein [Cytobacillus eiseniae]MBP2242450.1 peptidoglycan hydrolase CwlO-like protein [Cytobacillus eiseniae]
MKRKILTLGIGIVLGCSSLLMSTSSTTYAVTNKQLEDKKKDIQENRSNIQSEINQAKDKLEEIGEEKSNVEKEIDKIELSIADTESKIKEKEVQINDTKLEIQRLEEEIQALKEQIEKRDKLLKERIRSIQENGGVINYLDVLLGAQSFGDFINRVSAVTSFMEADRDLLRMHQEDKALLDQKEAEAKKQLEELNNKLAELEGMKKKLGEQKAEQNRLYKELEQEEQHMHGELLEFEDKEAILAAQEKAINAEIAAWKKKQRELEEQRKKQGNNSVGAAPAVTNGTFMNPATGRLTSHYGQRWGRLHSGIDIGKGGRTENVPIVASAAGIVIKANFDRSYGNVVMITHVIDGQVMTTVYGHLETLFVSNGQRVEKGQQLGYMGNTGNSTGPHLHFEIHNGPWNGSRSNSVNPLKYVNY